MPILGSVIFLERGRSKGNWGRRNEWMMMMEEKKRGMKSALLKKSIGTETGGGVRSAEERWLGSKRMRMTDEEKGEA